MVRKSIHGRSAKAKQGVDEAVRKARAESGVDRILVVYEDDSACVYVEKDKKPKKSGSRQAS
jgi:hypothetical protein